MIDSVVHTQQRNDAAVVFLADFSAGGRMFLGLVIRPIVLLAISQKYCTFRYLYLQNWHKHPLVLVGFLSVD